ncbi:MAG: tRNA uridine-5-carboxymethylaminomethyl(34) synthesis GTPase MnmE [Spirochaetes bacterium]|nr:tRNA uridine-5-carboxymethylaminomethyl(34) synthesis GTPase MnmE [Spirochaetota bacterium]
MRRPPGRPFFSGNPPAPLNPTEGSPTIIALATPFSVSAIHLLRLSGPLALPFLREATGMNEVVPRHVYTRALRLGGRLLDRVVCFYFQAPASYTGEEMVEIQCHGSPLVAQSILKAAIAWGLAPAAPGEFTHRAFLNGKLTLEQAEAVDGLIRGASEFTRDNALRILERKSSLRFDEARETLVSLLGELETSIEFPEHETDDLFRQRAALYARFRERLAALGDFLEQLTRNYERGKKLEEGIRVVLLGRPNAGKSTLMNALLREDRVLVSPVEGTTRDFVRERLALSGVPVSLYDTAGLREDADELEMRGIAKTRELAQSADLVLVLVHEKACLRELSGFPDLPPPSAGSPSSARPICFPPRPSMRSPPSARRRASRRACA